MAGLLLALLASVSWGAADFLGGLKTRSIALPTVLAVSQAAGMVVLAVPLLIRQEPLAVDGRLGFAVAAGVGSISSLALLYYAMAKGNIVVAAPVAATGAVLPVIVGIVRGDALSTVAVAGMVLALAGAVAAAWEPDRSGATSGRLVAGALLAFGAAVATGAFFTMLSLASDEDPFWATFVMRFTACVLVGVALLVLLVRSRRTAAGPALDRRIGGRAWLALVAIGVCDAVAEISFATASTSGQLSIVAVLSSLYPVITVLLAVAVLRERVHALQAAGAISALTGVVLLASAT